MIDAIIQHPVLNNIIRETCSDNGLFVEIDGNLLNNGCLDSERIIILKTDAYYSSHIMHNPPPSVDCIIVVKCQDESYKFYIVELRNCTGTSLIKTGIIEHKFKTIADDFFTKQFPAIFSTKEYSIRSVKLWLVTDPFKTGKLNEEQYKKKIKGSVIEQYLSIKPLRILGKIALITPILPRIEKPYPKITGC